MSEELYMPWSQFLQEAKIFFEISQKINDTWILHEQHNKPSGTYLIYRQKLPFKLNDNDDLEMLQLEYHVVYSISYQVPMIYFQAHKSDGSLLNMEDSWRIFNKNEDKSRADMLETLTQMEHPVLFRPFLALHPCRTATLLGQTSASSNLILTFISLMGPYIQLKLKPEYGLMVTPK